MPTKSLIIDGTYGTGQTAGVSSAGEVLVVGIGTLKTQSAFNSLNVINAAFNFFGPIAGQQFIITSIVITGSGAMTPTIQIYEASSSSTAVIDKLLLKLVTVSSVQTPLTFVYSLPFGGFLQVSEGEYLNAQTDTATVNINIIGYYQPIFRTIE
jgi:hypothetical protein